MGVEIVAVKMGDKGCYVTSGEENKLYSPTKFKPSTPQAQATHSMQVSSTV